VYAEPLRSSSGVPRNATSTDTAPGTERKSFGVIFHLSLRPGRRATARCSEITAFGVYRS
jgi:hypothetical protein